MSKFRGSLSAFSIVELSVVCAIIGVLIFASFKGISILNQSKIKSLAVEIAGFKSAISNFRVANNGYNPGDASSSTLLDVNSSGFTPLKVGNGDGYVSWGSGSNTVNNLATASATTPPSTNESITLNTHLSYGKFSDAVFSTNSTDFGITAATDGTAANLYGSSKISNLVFSVIAYQQNTSASTTLSFPAYAIPRDNADGSASNSTAVGYTNFSGNNIVLGTYGASSTVLDCGSLGTTTAIAESGYFVVDVPSCADGASGVQGVPPSAPIVPYNVAIGLDTLLDDGVLSSGDLRSCHSAIVTSTTSTPGSCNVGLDQVVGIALR